MKILLVAINAKYIHSNPAVYSLKKYAEEYAENIEIAEYTINNSLDHIIQSIYSKGADVICFSCYIWNISVVENVANVLSKICPQADLWVGGPEVSFDTRGYLNAHPYISGIIAGEGEETFKDLCKYYSGADKEMTLRQIPGLYFWDGEHTAHTPERDCLDLDCIPFYYEDLEIFENRIIYYESSRGCPFSCSYCLSSLDKKVRLRSFEKVKKELSFFLENKVKQVKFIDRTFNCNSEHAFKIWQFIKENDNGVTNFHFEIGADLLTTEQISLLNTMRPGLVQLEIGVQSTNEKTIAAINRSMDLKRLSDNVRAVSKGNNIHQHLDLIAGLPYEDYQSFEKSFNNIIALRPNQLQLGFLKVLKGSLMESKVREYGLIYKPFPPYEVLGTKWLGFNDIIKIKGAEEMLEVYYNSGQFFLTMEIILRCVKSPFDFFEKLGEFYFQNGYNTMSFSRIGRCKKLLEFLDSKEYNEVEASIVIDLEMIKEALVFDLYARENCKSRPGWARDKEELKAMTKEYCKDKGSKAHVEAFSYDFKGLLENREALPSKTDKLCWLLFDYESISPITGMAEYKEVN